MKCTQKSADRRYANVAALARDLKRSIQEPDGDFVKIAPLTSPTNTVIVTPEEMARIQGEAAFDSDYDDYDDWDDDECDGDCDDCDCDCALADEDYFEVECPSCGETICFDGSIDPEELACPACGEKFECLVSEEDLEALDAE